MAIIIIFNNLKILKGIKILVLYGSKSMFEFLN